MAAPDSDERPIWGAQLHVRPRPGCDGGLGGAAGAYVWVFALSGSEERFETLVSSEMERLGLFIAEIEDCGRVLPHPDDAPDLSDLYANLSDGSPVQYGSFHTYPEDDA